MHVKEFGSLSDLASTASIKKFSLTERVLCTDTSERNKIIIVVQAHLTPDRRDLVQYLWLYIFVLFSMTSFVLRKILKEYEQS